MLRRLTVVLLVALPAAAGVWPEKFGAFQRVSVAAAAPTGDPAVWEELGLEEGEAAVYTGAGKRFTAAAFRLRDSTSALAAFQWQRPPEAKDSPLARLAVETSQGVLLAVGNYLLRLEGHKPAVEELIPVTAFLPRLEESALPSLIGYLPREGRVENSERYVLGPVSIERFVPRVPPSVAGFHYGAEGQVAKFKTAGGVMDLAIFYYPTPHIARERLVEFQKLPGAMAKRSGPLVAVLFSPADVNAAERLLAQVRYQASLSWNESLVPRTENFGDLLISIFILIGVLLLMCLAGGMAVAGLRMASRKFFGGASSEDPMIMLHLDRK